MATYYTFRKSAIEKPQHLELTENGIQIVKDEGKPKAFVSYKDLESIRLKYLANNRYRTNNYCCQLKVRGATFDIYSNSYKGIGNFVDQAEDYVPFVKELVNLTKIANPNCLLYAGQTPFVFYGNIVAILIMVFFFSLVFHHLPVSPGFNIFVKVALIGYYAVFLVKSFVINKPGQFTGEEIPTYVLP